MDKSIKIENLIEKQGKERPLILFAKSDLYDHYKYIYKGLNLFFGENNQIKTTENISLYDSLDCFIKPKIISKENWLCNHCKSNLCKRNMSLYKLPYYLIIQLKKEKDEFIEYKEILNLKDYISSEDKDNSIYDLYAVLLKKEAFPGYNYFNYCKNFNNWISFSNNELKLIENPNTRIGYLLFYKRRNLD